MKGEKLRCPEASIGSSMRGGQACRFQWGSVAVSGSISPWPYCWGAVSVHWHRCQSEILLLHLDVASAEHRHKTISYSNMTPIIMHSNGIRFGSSLNEWTKPNRDKWRRTQLKFRLFGIDRIRWTARAATIQTHVRFVLMSFSLLGFSGVPWNINAELFDICAMAAVPVPIIASFQRLRRALLIFDNVCVYLLFVTHFCCCGVVDLRSHSVNTVQDIAPPEYQSSGASINTRTHTHAYMQSAGFRMKRAC